jgi:hypothetical protein
MSVLRLELKNRLTWMSAKLDELSDDELQQLFDDDKLHLGNRGYAYEPGAVAPYAGFDVLIKVKKEQ